MPVGRGVSQNWVNFSQHLTPPEISQELSRAAASAKSLTGKALTQHLERSFLHSQTLVFPQNRPTVAVRHGLHQVPVWADNGPCMHMGSQTKPTQTTQI